MMILGALVLRPLPPAVADRVEAYADELSVDDGMLARRFASGQLGLAVRLPAQRVPRTGAPERASALHRQQAATPGGSRWPARPGRAVGRLRAPPRASALGGG